MKLKKVLSRLLQEDHHLNVVRMLVLLSQDLLWHCGKIVSTVCGKIVKTATGELHVIHQFDEGRIVSTATETDEVEGEVILNWWLDESLTRERLCGHGYHRNRLTLAFRNTEMRNDVAEALGEEGVVEKFGSCSLRLVRDQEAEAAGGPHLSAASVCASSDLRRLRP